MFHKNGILFQSDLLSSDGIVHGFSTREGGVSRLPHTASMNAAEGHGDPAETVRENVGILARTLTGGMLTESAVVCAPQIHSAKIRYVTKEDAGFGVTLPAGVPGDGFFTDAPGILLLVRVADCVPILFTARRADGSPLVAAVHAGWRGTAAGIAAEAVHLLTGAGAAPDSIRAAVGQCIHDCCFEVQADFVKSVADARDADFAARHILSRDGRLYADLVGMNTELLRQAGLTEAQIDVSPHCTACNPALFHSHRAAKGLRGAMAAVIGILPTTR